MNSDGLNGCLKNEMVRNYVTVLFLLISNMHF